MRHTSLTGLFIALVVGACSSRLGDVPVLRSQDTPSTAVATAIPKPPLAGNYTPGDVAVPPSSHLFMEALIHDEASGSCLYPPAAEQPPLGYEYRSGVLVVDWKGLDVGLVGSHDQEDVVEAAMSSPGFVGHRSTESYSLGGATRAWLTVLKEIPSTEEFPYNATGSPVTVEALLEGGRAVVSIRGETFLLEPGAIWQESQPFEPQPGCLVTRTITLINHGLIHDSELEFTDGPIV